MTKTRIAELKDRLKEALDAKQMRAVELTQKTGVPKSAVSFYLAGKSQPKADRLYLIARALDVSETWLLGYDVPMARSIESKKNDQLAKLVIKMRSDESLYNDVVALSELTEKQRQAVRQLIAAFDE
jgi:transcriptional regulator with XRE-family HTH domain